MDIEIEFESENLVIDEDDENELSLEQVIQYMEEAWLNEKFAPEILPHKTEIVELLLGQISYMETRIKQLENTDFKKSIHQMEIDRLRFLITSYLRIRLEKIEMYSTHILKQEKERADKNYPSYLNKNELEFLQEYEKGLNKHFELVMKSCPTVMDSDIQIVQPNLHSMVFVKSKKDIEGVAIDDGKADNNDLTDLTEGSQVLISYNSVAQLVKDGDVYLF